MNKNELDKILNDMEKHRKTETYINGSMFVKQNPYWTNIMKNKDTPQRKVDNTLPVASLRIHRPNN